MNKMKGGSLLIGLILNIGCLIAQNTPLLFRGATLHLGDGTRIEGGDVLIHEGKILGVGKQIEANTAQVIDVAGKHIYPGIICLNSFIGLNEIDAVRATRDYVETGMLNPNARSLVAFNTDSKQLPTALFNGITYVQSVPQGGLVSGSSSLMRTSAWNWEDAVIKQDDGIHVFWPETNPWEEPAKQEERIANATRLIADLFLQAEKYNQVPSPEQINLRYASLKGLFDGSKRLYVHAVSATAILQSLNYFKQFAGMKVVLVGADEAYLLMDFIKERKVSVILNHLHRLPRYNHEDIDMPYKLPALLMKAGIPVAIGHTGSWESRNLMFNAGTAAAYGLTKEEALMCITGNAAKICGIDHLTGILSPGMAATLLISEGDILDMGENRLRAVYLDGKEVQLTGQQQELYERYKRKFGLN